MATTMAAAGARFRAIRRGDGLRSRRCVVTRAVRDSRRDVRTRAGRETRLDVQAVIPMLQGDATEQTPPDLPSFLFKNRIVYLVRGQIHESSVSGSPNWSPARTRGAKTERTPKADD